MKRVEGEVFIGDWKSSGDVRAVSGRTLRESVEAGSVWACPVFGRTYQFQGGISRSTGKIVYVPRGGLKINT